MRSSPFDSAVAGKSVLITETRMEPLQLGSRGEHLFRHRRIASAFLP